MSPRLESYLVEKGLCESLAGLNENMLAVVLVDDRGRIIDIKRGGSGSFDEVSEARRTALFEDLALRHIMRNEFAEEGGKEEYTITKRHKMIIFSFPINGLLLIVITDPFIDTYHLCKKVLKKIASIRN